MALGGPLRVVASTDLGDLGLNEGDAAIVEWHWYYHLLGFAGWGLIVALLVFVKENRDRSAWLILIPFFLLSEIIWPSAIQWFSLPLAVVVQIDLPYQSVVAAWTATWLLSPWLAQRRPAVAFLLTLGVGAIVSTSAAVGVSPPMPEFSQYVRLCANSLVIPGIYTFALPSACALNAWHCRKNYHPPHFLLWLGPSLFVTTFSIVVFRYLCLFVLSSFEGRTFGPFLQSLVLMSIFSLGIAATLYLLNLPFMYLAFHCPAYRNRFHKVLRLPLLEQPAGP